MADIKRLNYFTSQFLVENDFDDEQAYHLTSRRRHNRTLHTSGVAEGLDVTLVSGKQVRVGTGSAVDKDGQEIVLLEPVTYTLASGAAGQDVFLTIAYHEDHDPADKDVQGLGQFTRTTERPSLQDGTAVPPADGSVVVLARIHLSSATQIGSVDTTVRTPVSARLAPKSIGTAQLADGAVTLSKLAPEAQPLSVQATAPITVATDAAAKRITIGETHSARADNPHATTAAQIDLQGGANQLVKQINAGTGVIARTRVESAIVSGVITFQQVPFASNEIFSDEIDPGFGPGPLNIECSLEDVPTSGTALSADLTYVRTIMFRSVLDRTTGRFRVFAARLASGTGTEVVKVRWFASRPTAGPDASVAISVAVLPATATVISKTTQDFKATVNNTNNGNVTWKLQEGAAGGSLSNVTATSVTYSPPGLSGKYHLVATSALDNSKTATVEITVNADLTVTLNQTSATVLRGGSLALTATVINTDNKGLTWKIQEGSAGGALSSTTTASITYTAPLPAGQYHVTATSVVDANRFATCTVTVPAVTINLNQTSGTVLRGQSLALSATVGNTTDTSVSWSISEGSPTGGTLSAVTGNNITYTAPFSPGQYHMVARSNADQSKTQICTITVPPVTIDVTTDRSMIAPNTTTTVRATVTGASDGRATWRVDPSSSGGVVGPSTGTSTSFGSTAQGTFTVTGTSLADPTKSDSVSIDVETFDNR